MPDAQADLFRPPSITTKRKSIPRKSQLGQFMTPAPIAQFMAQFFEGPFPEQVRLLDAGAGQGSLTAAFVDVWQKRSDNGQLLADVYEADSQMLDDLLGHAAELSEKNSVQINVVPADFIEKAASMIRLNRGPRYTHAILNPPYRKINNLSSHRTLLSAAGLETVNLYSGFVGLAVGLLETAGEIVAIIPRSFCNGPYYQPFRKFLFERTAIRHVHLFEARNKAFRDDGVLQENIIIHMQRGLQQGPVIISTSADDSFADYQDVTYPFEQIVFPDDVNQFIHIPTGASGEPLPAFPFKCTLDDLGITVSTGPVVDFRMRENLCTNPEPGTVPLLYPGHFSHDAVEWPRFGYKKPNAIRHNQFTQKWLYPGGFYAVVRRFSSKEERRRVVANVVDPSVLNAPMIGFENHLNVFHVKRRPLTEDLARGLTTYLNTTSVDQFFRRFNGHTQVNATDLRNIRYPSRNALISLGAWSKKQKNLSQEIIDQRVNCIE